MANIPIYGDLVVSGSAKVGSDPRSATIAGAGTIRRDGSAIQFSDGSNWVTLAAGNGISEELAIAYSVAL